MNASIVYSSLKYLKYNFKLIVKLSNYINDQLKIINYNDHKLESSFVYSHNDIIESIIHLVQDKELIYKALESNCFNDEDSFEQFKLIFNSGIVNINDVNERKILLFACEECNIQLIKFLISKDVEIKPEIFKEVCRIDYIGSMINLLLNNGAIITNEIIDTAFDNNALFEILIDRKIYLKMLLKKANENYDDEAIEAIISKMNITHGIKQTLNYAIKNDFQCAIDLIVKGILENLN
jgi:hypothetical protein